ncbi:MAG: apolipoprotein N-acyltransferase [Clostridia bacterium]|nr:apolipoprotein N-acyltransferase [Clostridia bacterium]
MKQMGLTIFSALLAFLARRFSFLSFLMWIALVPFFLAISDSKKNYRLVALFGFVYYGLSISWLFSIGELPEFGLTGAVGFLFAFFCWFGLCIYGVVGYMALFYVLGKQTWLNGSPVVTACGFMLLEGIQGWGESPFAFPWCSFAYSQSGVMMQSSSLLGSAFITFLIVFVNSSFCHAYQKKSVRPLYAAGILLVANFLFGAFAMFRMPPGEIGTVSIVQNNIPSDKKWKNIDTISELESFVNRAQGDLIVFSETVYPAELTPYIAKKLCKDNAHVMVGAIETDYEGQRKVAMHMLKNDKVATTSYKIHLIPFGEYMPPGFGFLAKYLGLLSFKSGEDVYLHGEGNKKIGSLICFDSCFSSFAREAVQKGASLLAVSTNDSWFDGSEEAKQHMRMSAFRAVEQGRYMVHASTTGVTALIDPRGRVLSKLPEKKEGVLEGEIQYIQTRTLFSYVGDFPLILCLLVLIFEKRRGKNAVS